MNCFMKMEDLKTRKSKIKIEKEIFTWNIGLSSDILQRLSSLFGYSSPSEWSSFSPLSPSTNSTRMFSTFFFTESGSCDRYTNPTETLRENGKTDRFNNVKFIDPIWPINIINRDLLVTTNSTKKVLTCFLAAHLAKSQVRQLYILGSSHKPSLTPLLTLEKEVSFHARKLICTK